MNLLRLVFLLFHCSWLLQYLIDTSCFRDVLTADC